MKTKVLTTLSNEYYENTGQYTVQYWKDQMPSDWEFWVHDTPDLPIKATHSIQQKDKNTWIEKAAEVASTKPQPPGYMKEWHKFCHKSFAQWETYEHDPNGIMIWFDSDVRWKKQPTVDAMRKALNGKFCGYFGRDRVDTTQKKKQYPKLNIEACFIIYNLDHPKAKEFFAHFKNIYLSMEVFDLYDWCDTGVFEEAMLRTGKEHFNDITGDLPPALAPLPISFLDEYFEHWMGSANKEARDDLSGKKERDKLIKRGLLK